MGHSTGVTDGSTHARPAGQILQPCWAVSVLYKPAAHAVHDAAAPLENEPAGHSIGTGEEEFPAQKYPGGHEEHCVELVWVV